MRIGRPRQEFRLGSQAGNFLIKERSDKIHRQHYRGGEHYYVGECIGCGYLATKTLWNFRKYPGHIGCPPYKLYKREVAFKQYPGTFQQFIKGMYDLPTNLNNNNKERVKDI